MLSVFIALALFFYLPVQYVNDRFFVYSFECGE